MIPELHFPWLECSILLPLIGAIACAILPNQQSSQRVAIVVSSLTLLFTAAQHLLERRMNPQLVIEPDDTLPERNSDEALSQPVPGAESQSDADSAAPPD